MTLILPNGKPIDKDMLEMAMEDSDLSHSYFLNIQTGEVEFLSEEDRLFGENDQLLEEIEGTENYIEIERIPSHEAYQWMEDFVTEIVEPQNRQIAKKLFNALNGKGSFRRFKDTLNDVGDEWMQAWYQWRDARLDEAVKKWLADQPLTLAEE